MSYNITVSRWRIWNLLLYRYKPTGRIVILQHCRVVYAISQLTLLLLPCVSLAQPLEPAISADGHRELNRSAMQLISQIRMQSTPSGIVWSGDGTRIACLIDAGNIIAVLSREGHMIGEMHRNLPFAGQGLGFLADNSQLAAPRAFYDQHDVLLSIFDVANGRIVRELIGPHPGQTLGNKALVIAVSPDQSVIAAVAGGPPHGIQPVHLYSGPNWDIEVVLPDSVFDPGISARVFAFSSDSKLLAIGRSDGSIVLYDLTSRRLIRDIGAFTRYDTPIASLAFGDADQHLAAGTAMAFKTWRYPDGTWAPLNQGKFVAIRAPDPVRVYRVSDGALIASAVGNFEPIFAMSGRREDDIFAFISGDGTLHLWDAAHSTFPELAIPLGPYATSAAFSPDGNWLAAGGEQTLDLWRLLVTKR